MNKKELTENGTVHKDSQNHQKHSNYQNKQKKLQQEINSSSSSFASSYLQQQHQQQSISGSGSFQVIQGNCNNMNTKNNPLAELSSQSLAECADSSIVMSNNSSYIKAVSPNTNPYSNLNYNINHNNVSNDQSSSQSYQECQSRFQTAVVDVDKKQQQDKNGNVDHQNDNEDDETFQLSLDDICQQDSRFIEAKPKSQTQSPSHPQPYPRDNRTLSMLILEQQEQQSMSVTMNPNQEEETLPAQIKNMIEERKRKRKEIFAKFKKKDPNNMSAGEVTRQPDGRQMEASKLSVLDTIQEVFSMARSPKHAQKLSTNSPPSGTSCQEQSNISSSLQVVDDNQHQNRSNNCQHNYNLYKDQQASSPNATATTLKKSSIDPNKISIIKQSVNSIIHNPNNRNNSEFEQSPSALRDSLTEDLQSILQSQLFEQERLDYTIRQRQRQRKSPQQVQSRLLNGQPSRQYCIDFSPTRTTASYKNIDITTINPSMMVSENSQVSPQQQSQLQDLMGKGMEVGLRFAVANDINQGSQQQSQSLSSVNYHQHHQKQRKTEKAYQQQGAVVERQLISPFQIQGDQNVHQIVHQKENDIENKDQQNYKSNPIDIQQNQQTEHQILIKMQCPAENSQQQRISLYLRQIRRLNTIIPNFHWQNQPSQVYFQYQKDFKVLLQQFKKGVNLLYFTNQKISFYLETLKSIDALLINNLTVQNFVSSNWQQKILKPEKDLHLIRQQICPRQNFIRRDYSYAKAKQALNNYLELIEYYEKSNLNLKDLKAQKKYLDVRNKFWQIEKNMKMIGEDLYMASVEKSFPEHYFDFLYVLKRNKTDQVRKKHNMKNSDRVKYLRKILGMQYRLKAQGELLSISQIGQKVRKTVETQLHRRMLV